MTTDQSKTSDGSARDEERTAPQQKPAAKPAAGTAAETTKPAAGTAAETTEPAAGTAAETTEPAAGTAAETKPAAEKTTPAAENGKPAANGDDSAEERWSAFASAEEPPPGRGERARRAGGRFLAHEWTLAALASLALAVLMTWPTLRYPLHTIPQDYWDPSLQAWQMAWSGHILLADPGMLWHANTFYPESWSFAFSDTLLGYAPAGMLGTGPEAALLRYNIIFVLAHALATFGAYVLARQLGAGRIGGAVAGVGFAYAPWLLSQAGHLHVVSNGGIPLALAMLARGHGYSLRYGYRPARSHAGWAIAGWLVATWQISLGFGIGLPFVYILAALSLAGLVTWYVRRFWINRAPRPFGRRLLIADLGGGLVFAISGALLSIPFFKVTEAHPYAERSPAEIDLFSPSLRSFFIAPAESQLWGELHTGARSTLTWAPEMTLLGGFALYALALGGLFFSVFALRHRLLLLAGVLVTGILAMGTKFFGGTYTYLLLVEYLPGWSGLRTPGRMMLWTTLFLALLAAGAVTAFAMRVRELAATRIPPWPGPWLRLATLLPLLLVIVEGVNVTPHPTVPEQPAALRTTPGPMLVLPSSSGIDQLVMLWSTSAFQDVVNGGSGFTPRRLDETRRVTLAFPDQESVTYLRAMGVRSVVVLRDRVGGTPWETAINLPVDHLGIRRIDEGDTIVYRLD